MVVLGSVARCWLFKKLVSSAGRKAKTHQNTYITYFAVDRSLNACMCLQAMAAPTSPKYLGPWLKQTRGLRSIAAPTPQKKLCRRSRPARSESLGNEATITLVVDDAYRFVVVVRGRAIMVHNVLWPVMFSG